MNMDELVQLGASIFQKSNLSGDAGSNLNIEALKSALSGLAGSGKGFDINSLLDGLKSGGLADIAQSWLGDGANQAISPEQIGNVVSQDKLADFASKLGISLQEAQGGLSEALPQMVDKASSGGSLLDSIGGVEGVLGMAGKLFK
jgi:uncharacterized protein YidB (DUF937 family)